MQFPDAIMANLEDFVLRADKAEREVDELLKQLEVLEPQVQAAAAAKENGESEEVPEELAKLRAENGKLKYRLNILQRATDRVMVSKGTQNERKLCFI